MPSRRATLAGLAACGPLGFALQRLGSSAPDAVEQAYSRSLYPWLAALVGTVPRFIPFPVVECLAAALVVLLIASLGRAWRGVQGANGVENGNGAPEAARAAGAWRARFRRLGSWALRVAAVVSLGYAVLVALWALNGSRQPLEHSLGLDRRPRSVAELQVAAEALEQEAAELRATLPEDADGVFRAADRRALLEVDEGFARSVDGVLGWPGPSLPRPKAAFISPLLTRLGVSGIHLGFTAEPLVNGGMPDAALPSAAAHEKAHQRGFTREDEAEYLAWVACRAHPSAEIRYSGLLDAASSLRFALASATRSWEAPELARVRSLETPALHRDRAAIARFWQPASGMVAALARRVNDAYLKSQGQPAGVHSYGLAVDLLLAERRKTAP